MHFALYGPARDLRASLASAVVLGALSAAPSSFADTRSAIWSIHARPLSAGDIELETRLTNRRWFGGTLPDGTQHGRLVSGGNLHLATIAAPAQGWELAVLAVVTQPPTLKEEQQAAILDHGAIQARRQLSPRRQEREGWDLLVQAEIDLPFESHLARGYAVGATLAFEANWGELGLLANIGLAFPFDRSGTEIDVSWSLSTLYEFADWLHGGLETFGQSPVTSEARNRRSWHFGPTLSLKRGRLRAGISLVYGPDKASDQGMFDPLPVPVEPPQLLGVAHVFNGFLGRIVVGVSL